MMTLDSQLLAFTLASALMAITPGNDTVLTVNNSLAGGPKAGLATMLGIVCGCFVHAAFSALGISLILVRSASVFDTVKLAGAAYLIFLGVRGLWTLYRKSAGSIQIVPAPGKIGKTARRAFLEGLLTNILNPKVAIFYLSFLPQFINSTDSVLARSFQLAGIHQFVGAIWLSCIVLFVNRLRGLLTRTEVRQGLEGLTSAVLIALGVKLALAKR
jgi:threonine/homoserine/homoserine lactone efflux protein